MHQNLGLNNGHFVKIGRKKFIPTDGLMVQSNNPFDFTINEGMYVHIYYENFIGMSDH